MIERKVRETYYEVIRRQNGIIGEQLFEKELAKLGVKTKRVDTWYDYEVFDKKIEVKSASVSIYNGNAYRIGRFDFTNPENRRKQRAENIWICFIARFKRKHLILGLCKSKQLKNKRYTSIHDLQNVKLTNLKEWIKQNYNKLP